jgi:hypothetical protein
MTSPAVPGACPRCGATNLQAVAVKRSSVDRALVAEYLRAAGGRETGSPETIMQHVCERCGCRWIPRTTQERQLRASSGQLGPEAMRAAQAQQAIRNAPARKWEGPKIRPLTLALIVIIVLLLILVVATS